MHGNLPPATQSAIIPADTSVAEKSISDTSVGDDENWFADCVLRLLGKEIPGKALDCITGLSFGERNCQRYAAGHVKPTAYFLRALIRSKDGGPFFLAMMDGCKAEWWVEFQEMQRLAAQRERIAAIINE